MNLDMNVDEYDHRRSKRIQLLRHSPLFEDWRNLEQLNPQTEEQSTLLAALAELV